MNHEKTVMRSLVSLAIEKSLLEISKPALDNITEYLKENHNCQIQDCYDHPEYLRAALVHIFGKGRISISNSIKSCLEEYVYDNKISVLIKTMNAQK